MRNFIKEEEEGEEDESSAFPAHKVSVCFCYILYHEGHNPLKYTNKLFLLFVRFVFFFVRLELGDIRLGDFVGAKIPLFFVFFKPASILGVTKVNEDARW